MRKSGRPSHGKLAFEVLRALMLGYRMWGRHSGWEVTQLACFVDADAERCAAILDYLQSHGWVQLDHAAGRARLTRAGVEGFLGSGRSAILTGTSPTAGSVC